MRLKTKTIGLLSCLIALIWLHTLNDKNTPEQPTAEPIIHAHSAPEKIADNLAKPDIVAPISDQDNITDLKPIHFIQQSIVHVPIQARLQFDTIISQTTLKNLIATQALTLQLGNLDLPLNLSRSTEGYLIVTPTDNLSYNCVYQLQCSAQSQNILGFSDLIFLSQRQGTSAGQLADINRDGTLEVIAGNYQLDISVSKRDDNKNFNAESFADTSFNSTGLELADLNQDGQLDMVLSVLADSKIKAPLKILVNHSDDKELAMLSTDADLVVDDTLALNMGMALAIADLDNDGDEDIIVADFANGLRLFINQGGSQAGTIGNFQEETFSSKETDDDKLNYATGLAIADIDHDGDLDIFMTRAYRQDQLFLNESQTGTSNFDFALTSNSLPTATYNSSSAAFADLDQDGDSDLVLGVLGGNNRLYINQGKARDYPASNIELGLFKDETASRAGDFLSHQDFTTAVDTAPISNSGATDIIIANLTGDNNSTKKTHVNRLLMHTNYKTFHAVDLNNQGNNDSLAIASGDLDSPRDGKLDLMVFSNGENINLSSAQSVFKQNQSVDNRIAFDSIEVDNFYQSLQVNDLVRGDWNNDGNEDLAIAGNGGIIYFMFNHLTADQQYELWSLELNNSADLLAITTADIDLDGDLDLFVSTATKQNLLILNNSAQGDNRIVPFDLNQTYPSRWNDIDIVALDYDRDGDIDFVTVGEHALGIYENQRDELAPFNYHYIAHDDNNIQKLLLADLDQDAHQELILIGDNTVTVFHYAGKSLPYEQLSTLTFDETISDAQLIDLSQNASLELVTTSASGLSQHTWHNNQFGTATPITIDSDDILLNLNFHDIDLDGDLDLIAIASTGQAQLYMNNGDTQFKRTNNNGSDLHSVRSFTEATEYFSDTNLLHITNSDHDGHPDILLFNHSAQIQIILNR